MYRAMAELHVAITATSAALKFIEGLSPEQKSHAITYPSIAARFGDMNDGLVDAAIDVCVIPKSYSHIRF